MLDTNALNKATDVPKSVFAGRKVFVTHIQRDELATTNNPIVRASLLKTFVEIAPTSLATETFVLNDSRLGEARLSAGDGMYTRLLQRIADLDAAQGKKVRNWKNQSRDARIAETAIKLGLTLVTDDRNLTQATNESGGTTLTFEGFCEFK